MSDPAREIIEVLAAEAERANDGKGWSFVVLQQMARCARRLIAEETGGDP